MFNVLVSYSWYDIYFVATLNQVSDYKNYSPSLYPTGLRPDVPFLAEAIPFPRLATDRMTVVSSSSRQNPGKGSTNGGLIKKLLWLK